MTSTNAGGQLALRAAAKSDVPVLLRFIRELADYERLSHEVVADADTLTRSLFGGRRVAEAVIASRDGTDAGFVLFFHTFSTFLGRPGLYVEDLYVQPQHRGVGIGKALLRHVAGLAVERGCGRVEWAVLDWNEPAVRFYERAGARPLSEWTTYRLTGPALAAFAGSE
ncbi:MAG: GNAT family N-acetyltransferase [Gammaproteobacteria bacterium]|nr:GNAT family N-acetyltransferase [Gammaproteobacteria bacterium]